MTTKHYNTMKGISLQLAILLFIPVSSILGNENTEIKIKGIVIDSKTDAPIPHTEVFISGTTYGSITNAKGEFELKTNSLPCKLVASHISYAPFSIMIDKESMLDVTIKLILYEHEIMEISVEGKSSRKRNLKLFKKAFIGTDEFANSCTILNDSVLSFRWDSMIFTASAHQPIIIDNPKLGYIIKIILEEFNLIYDSDVYNKIRKNKNMVPPVEGVVYQWLCNFHFIPYPQKEKRQQQLLEKTRIKTYYGSKEHFLKALYSGYPEEQGYHISPDLEAVPITEYRNLDVLPGTKIVFLDPVGNPDKLLICPEKSMVVQYFEDYYGRPLNLNLEDWTAGVLHKSEIIFTSDKCTIRYNGTTFDYCLTYTGYFGNQKISTLLPDNFNPDK